MQRIPNDRPPLRLALPKGRMQEGVLRLCAEAGVQVRSAARGYRPTVSLEGCEAKLLKPQNVALMLGSGSRDVGFCGADWVEELGLELVELCDTGLDPVRVVAAAPAAALQGGRLPAGPLVVASEYERLAARWIESQGLQASFVRTYGATEVFPPEDADVIVDNTATGSTLAANGLEIIAELMASSTRLYASPRALDEPQLAARIEELALLVRSVVTARERVMVEVNVEEPALRGLLDALPCMREPTVASLAGQAGFAIKAAVPRTAVAALIPALKARGGSDIVVSPLSQIVP